jgi:hypothetical protein
MGDSMRKYLIFNTFEQAEVAARNIDRSMGLDNPVYNKNAATGATDFNSQPTLCWAVPRQIVDGRWVVLSPNSEGISADPAWFPKVTGA